MIRRTRALQPDDLPRLRYVGSRSFGIDDASTVDVWVERGGMHEWRVHTVDSVVQGGALRIPMGIWFGGRSVPTIGFAGVCVAPEARGAGVGEVMMADALREARADGVPVSTLNPSTRAFYRKLGYELAGDQFEIDLELQRVPARISAARVVRFEDSHRPAVRGLRTEVHRRRPGAIDRGPYIWNRIESPRRNQSDGYLFYEGSDLVGYCFVSLPAGDEFYDLKLNDWTVASPAGLDALMQFLRGHRSLANRCKYAGAAHDPITASMPPRTAQVKLYEGHMLRILDVQASLTARGYPEGVDAEVCFSVTEDPLFEENLGTYHLRVKDGRAQVSKRPGDKAPVRANINGLAALYASYFDVETLVRMGWIEAEASAWRPLAQIFSGPRPYLDHMY